MEYLAALGIDMYMPRRQLPGARPSPVLAARPPALPESPRCPAIPVTERSLLETPSVNVDNAGIHQLVDALVEDKSVPRQPVHHQAQRAGTASAATTASIRFVLNCWRVSPDLLIIDSHQPGRALPTDALLCNILRAIGLPARLPQAETLRWPVIRQSEARLSDAREMVGGFLAGHMQARPVESVWLMGEAAIRVCTDHDAPINECLGQKLSLPGVAVPALALPSLLDMLVDSRLKAVTWHAVRSHHVRE